MLGSNMDSEITEYGQNMSIFLEELVSCFLKRVRTQKNPTIFKTNKQNVSLSLRLYLSKNHVVGFQIFIINENCKTIPPLPPPP